MGYFNYFIKCIIRKFVNLLFKPKILLTFLIVISLLFILQISSRAEWTDDDILYFYESVANITSNQGVLITQLSNLGVDVSEIRTLLNDVDLEIQMMRQNTFIINSNLIKVINILDTISTNISDIYNKLDENQQELLTELKTENKAVLDELNMIRDSINGSDDESTTFTNNGIIHSINSSNGYETLRCMSIDYEKSYTYTVTLTFNNPFAGEMFIDVYYNDNLLSEGYNFDTLKSNFIRIGTVPPNTSNYIIKFEVPSNNPKYIYYTWGKQASINVTRKIKGLVESLNQSNSLQQQQNQLQQQQNNFLQQGTSDSDVSVDSFNSVESNDITSLGLNGVFNSIYSSITSWNSKNINLPIPYTDKSIVIPANYTENMLNSSGGGWIITFIHAVYYFIVGRFMIYSITNIVNSIKSGSILNTNSKNNITMDML